MKRNFVELRNFLAHRYPELQGKIAGENYPPPPYANLAVSAAGTVQMGGIVLMMFGSQIFNTLGMPEPEWYKELQENKMMAFCGVFFMNSMANSLTTTGAFEVLLDGEVVYSKLETGRMPNGRQLIELMEQKGIEMVEPPQMPQVEQ
uniref:Selenoprotein T n=1 Tax=Florenciella parvula TaxID=236787 RepID=A0A7S2D3C0_9STRA|mmetsp:Transcript_8644/g.18354  ORF Transcript_8644/g.18354 Transcript_8644/m.18354 type:complete len:147 (+) Transcript_8644:594-1034(+)